MCAFHNGCRLLSHPQWPRCLRLSYAQNHHPAKVSSDPGYLAIQHRAFLAIFYLLPSIVLVNNVYRALTILSSRQLLLLPDTTTSTLCLGSCLHTAIGLSPPSNHCASQLLCRNQCYLCFGAACLFSISSYLAQVCALLFSPHHQHQRSITPPACFIAPFLPPKPLASFQDPSCDANIPSPGCLLCRSSLCPASIRLIFPAQWGSQFEDGKVSVLLSWGAPSSLPFHLGPQRVFNLSTTASFLQRRCPLPLPAPFNPSLLSLQRLSQQLGPDSSTRNLPHQYSSTASTANIIAVPVSIPLTDRFMCSFDSILIDTSNQGESPLVVISNRVCNALRCGNTLPCDTYPIHRLFSVEEHHAG